MTTALITPPAHEPLRLSEVKLHLRIDHDDEDELLNDLIKAARQYCEFSCGQKLITQVWRQYESKFPTDGSLRLLLAPVQGIVAISAYDRDGNGQTLASSATHLHRSGSVAEIEFEQGFDPAVAANGLEIDLQLGIGDLGVDIPDTLKRAILLLVAHWYEFRGAISPQQQPVSIPPGFDGLMAPHRKINL